MGYDDGLLRFVKDNVTNTNLDIVDCWTVLNELNDENEQLKQEMDDLGTAHAEEINKIEDEFDEEILKLEKENEQLASELVECKALIIMLSDTTVSGRVENLIYSRYNFYSEDEYYEKLEEYKNKVIKELEE